MAETAEPSRGCWWPVLGVGLSATFVVLALFLLALALAVRGCVAGGDWQFSARIDEVHADEVCLSLMGDGPGYVENDCLLRTDVVGLPEDISAGECLLLTQKLHSDLIYEEHRPC